MAEDLVRSGRLIGMTRVDVQALLGPTDDERRSRVYPYPGWDVGRHPGMYDGTALMLRFDDDYRVVEVIAPFLRERAGTRVRRHLVEAESAEKPGCPR